MSAGEIASVDGRITPTHEAVIPLPDDGIYRGDGVFEVVRLYGGRPFAWAEHLERLRRSATTIELPVDTAALERELEALLATHGDGDAQLRVVATRGGRRILAIEPLMAHGESARVATVVYSPSVILDGVKSLSYAANMQATRIARARGADEAVLVTPEGRVLEPPTSTIFWADREGSLHTPALTSPVLDSITRRRVLAATGANEGEYHLSDLAAASEAFLASTTREVQPVAAIDDREVAWPGPSTREAQNAFARAVGEEV